MAISQTSNEGLVSVDNSGTVRLWETGVANLAQSMTEWKVGLIKVVLKVLSSSHAGTEGGGHCPPIFDRSVKPIPSAGGQIIPNYTGIPNVFHLPSSRFKYFSVICSILEYFHYYGSHLERSTFLNLMAV